MITLRGYVPTPTPPHEGRKKIVAVGGPKGGSGATFVASSLGLLAARHGWNVILIDACARRENVHTELSLSPPLPLSHEASAPGVFTKTLKQRIVPTGHPNLSYISARMNGGSLPEVERYIDAALDTEPDLVVVDLPSSSDELLTGVTAMADAGIVVTTPNRAGVELVHSYFKTRLLAALKGAAANAGIQLSPEILATTAEEGDIVALIETTASRVATKEKGDAFRASVYNPRPLFLAINFSRKREDHFLAPALCEIGEKLYGLDITPLNPVAYDPGATDIDERRLYVDQRPGSETTACLELLTKRIVKSLIDSPKPRKRLARTPAVRMNHYDLLNLDINATPSSVEQAYLQLSYIYSDNALAGFGGVGPHVRTSMLNAIHEAYHLLSQPEKRTAYDASLSDEEKEPISTSEPGERFTRLAELGASVERDLSGHGTSNIDGPRPVTLSVGSDISGAHLRNIRLAKGVTLDEIAAKTKVKKAYLEAIESEDRENFPAPIFIKGFLKSYARVLGLDANEICDKYMAANPPNG